jgi:hypothetical protein
MKQIAAALRASLAGDSFPRFNPNISPPYTKQIPNRYFPVGHTDTANAWRASVDRLQAETAGTSIPFASKLASPSLRHEIWVCKH